MEQENIDYAVIKNAVKTLAIIREADPGRIIDLLTGYLWGKETADAIKKSNGDYE
ncbi:MAG: hypothetical protein GY718_10180 [Lentisphaerae bacterium]|nr:hypothetical protein [Lentisphaerota bacterium]